ncbi:hypothetical protein [Chroococcidiopsis cubana]|uniref:hypothetical protein n=1 Tax=Chroococcidiopsis cubana TaxID=171392 RepID=UPI000F8EF341|nr:hypothetical protein [Chroococcidiopsis cubana]
MLFSDLRIWSVIHPSIISTTNRATKPAREFTTKFGGRTNSIAMSFIYMAVKYGFQRISLSQKEESILTPRMAALRFNLQPFPLARLDPPSLQPELLNQTVVVELEYRYRIQETAIWVSVTEAAARGKVMIESAEFC